jgi:hypothetical protein
LLTFGAIDAHRRDTSCSLQLEAPILGNIGGCGIAALHYEGKI